MNRLVSDFTDKFAISQSDAGNLVAYHSSRLMRTELGECTRNSSGVDCTCLCSVGAVSWVLVLLVIVCTL